MSIQICGIKLAKSDMKYIRGKYLCQIIDINAEVSHQVKSQICLRFWGYLSSRFESVYVSLIEAGLFSQILNWRQSRSQHGTVELQMMDAKGFLQPTPLNLKSAVGVSALYEISMQSLFLLVGAIRWICIFKQCLKNVAKFTPILPYVES